MSAINLESGQSEAAPPAGFTTPINKTAGTDLAHASEVGSVFVDGKRRSARANYSYTADGISAADELVMNKAKRRAATRNLDSPAATVHKNPEPPSPAGNPSPKSACIANFNSIGISMGRSANAINVFLMLSNESRLIGLRFSEKLDELA